MRPKLQKSGLVIVSDIKSLALQPTSLVNLPSFVAKKGNSSVPDLTYFTMEMTGHEIKIHTQTEVEVSLGIFANCDPTSWFEVAPGKNSKGGQTFACKTSRPPVQINGHHSSPGIKVLKDILIAISIGMSIIGMIPTGGAALMIAAAPLICLGALYMPDDIGEAAKQDAPSFDDLRAAFTGLVTWRAEAPCLNGCGPFRIAANGRLYS